MRRAIALVIFSALSVTASRADPMQDLNKCIEAYIVEAIKLKPSLVEYAVALDKICHREEQLMIHKHDDIYSSGATGPMKALDDESMLKMQQLGERYITNAKDRAVKFYSDIQRRE